MRARRPRLAPSRPSTRRPRPLHLEQLEDRLTPSWGSIPPAVISPPANATPVTQNGQGDASGSASIATTEVDWYRFTAASSGSYLFKATSPTGTLDTVAGLYSSTGGRIAFNDDISTSNRSSQFSATLVAGKTYYFGVTNYTNTPGGAYTWSLDGPSAGSPPPPPPGGSGDDGYEQNDTRLTASDLGGLTSVRTVSDLVMADGHDWFRFATSATGTTQNTVTLNFTNAQGNLNLQLYNSAGTLLRSSSSTSSNVETVSLSGLAAGTYYVHALGSNGAQNPNYTLTITPPGSPGSPPGGSPSGGYDIRLLTTGLTTAQLAIFEQAAQRWEAVITAGLPAATYNGMSTTGVIINASSVNIDGRGGILGQAGPDRFRPGSNLPYHGIMQFDSADLSALQSSGGLIYTVLHEMGHILGVGTLWQTKGLLSGASTSNPLFKGSRAIAEYNALFGVNSTGVPVENSGGSGTRNAHWRETTFRNELMTGYLNNGFNPLSRITVASLADLGYSVDMSRSDPYSPGGSLSGGGGGGAGGGGGGGSLRALPNSPVQDLLHRVAADVVKPGVTPPLAHSSIAATVQTLLQRTLAKVESATSESVTPAKPTPRLTPVAAAQSADAVFSGLSPLLTSRLG